MKAFQIIAMYSPYDGPQHPDNWSFIVAARDEEAARTKAWERIERWRAEKGVADEHVPTHLIAYATY